MGVLGSAIDVDYPAANAGLIADVAATGAVISEFPPGYPTMAENFPRRNRIISGLCCGSCIVEAPEKSGALITANLALEQGRDLFVVPGNADSPASAGSNALLRECGRAVSSGWDILSEYDGQYTGLKCVKAGAFSKPKAEEIRPSAAKTVIDKPPAISYSDLESRIAAFPEEQQKLLRCLGRGESHVDALIAETGLSPARVLADMTVLTIRGAVRALPGKHYTLNFK